MTRLSASPVAGLAAFVALVALVIAAPIAILGEASSNDARARLQSDELAGVAETADRAADLLRSRLAAVLDEVRGIVGSEDYRRAIDGGDVSTVGALLDRYKSVMSSDIERLLEISGQGVNTPIRTLYSVPAEGRLGQLRPAADYALPGTPRGVTSSQRIFVAWHAQGPPTIGIAAVVPGQSATESLVADIPVSHLAEWLRPIAGSRQRIYVFDESDRQIPGAIDGNAAVAEPMSDPIVAAVHGKDHAAERLSSSPSDTSYVASALVTSSAWHVIVVRPVSAAELNLGDASASQRWLRSALIGFLLIGAALVGWFAQRLRTQGKDLEAASRHKSQFLASMSHELRTPLNAIIGFSEVLLQRFFGELNPKQEEYLRDILSSGKHQLALVNDILDLSKVEAGRMELDVTRFSLAALVADSSAMLREKASQKGVQITNTTDATLGSIDGDERKIKQVLFNLLTNAIKFTPSGGTVTIAGQRTNAEVTVTVTDTGVGIAPEDQARIFEDFRQTAGSAGRTEEGTGLGLSLAKRFIELHGGTLRVVSALGSGSRFVFALPQPLTTVAH